MGGQSGLPPKPSASGSRGVPNRNIINAGQRDELDDELEDELNSIGIGGGGYNSQFGPP